MFILISVVSTMVIIAFQPTDDKNTNQPSGGEKTVIRKGPDKVEPSTLKIKVGTTVVFKNESNKDWQPHENNEVFVSNVLEKGASYKYNFNSPGEYNYHSHVGGPGGTIIVSE